MTDTMTPEQRALAMKRVKQRNGSLEKLVQHELRTLGLRFRCHDRSLPGCPDIVLPKYGTVIFVHGCFWHQHGCSRTTMPKTRRKFWLDKFEANRKRDQRVERALRRDGWSVMTIWECQTKDLDRLERRLIRFLDR